MKILRKSPWLTRDAERVALQRRRHGLCLTVQRGLWLGASQLQRHLWKNEAREVGVVSSDLLCPGDA